MDTRQELPRVEVYCGREGIRAIAADWRALQQSSRRSRFFHWHGWWECYLEALEADPDSVSFFLLRRGERPVAVVPLKRSVRRVLGLRTLQWRLPQHPHMPLADILCHPALTMPELMAALLPALDRHEGGRWDALLFDGVLEESPLSALADGRVHRTVLKSCDQIACAGTYESMTAAFSRNFRSNLNKARNKLARASSVEFSAVSTPPGLESGFEEFLRLEASGWKGRSGAGTAIALHPELLSFYRELIRELGPQGAVVINCLRVDGALIAGQFCLCDDDTLYVLKLAYDERWSHVAPGNMLLEKVIRASLAGAVVRNINLVGDPPWFKDWRPVGQNVLSIRLTGDTAGGWAVRTMLQAKQRLKPLYARYFKHPPARRSVRI